MNEEKPPLSLFKGAGTKDQRAELMRKLDAEWDEEVKFFVLMAKFKKMNFDEYVKAGFTPAQALELIK